MAYINGKKILQLVINNGGSESSTLITTTTDATLISGSTYELALTYLAETPKANDFIAYIDNGAITTLYKVTAVDSTNATLTKIGDIGGGGGGSQGYEHHIKIDYTQTGNPSYNICCVVRNDSNVPFTYSTFKQYLIDKGINSRDNSLNASGIFVKSAGSYDYNFLCQGIYIDNSDIYIYGTKIKTESYTTNESIRQENGWSNFADKVIPL